MLVVGADSVAAAARSAFPEAQLFALATDSLPGADFRALGIESAALEAVVLGASLQSLSHPETALRRLLPYLAPQAQIVASVANARNLSMLEALAGGEWCSGGDSGLDDIPPRHFTLRDLYRLFHAAGYRLTGKRLPIDPRWAEIYNGHHGQAYSDIHLPRLTLNMVSAEELSELCASRLLLRAEPGALSEAEFARSPGAAPKTGYARWRAARELGPVELAHWRRRVASWPDAPSVHVVLIADGDEPLRLQRSVDALAEQRYDKLLVTVVAVTPPPPGWRPRREVIWRQAQRPLADEVNAAALARNADWLLLLDAGDLLAEEACWFALEAAHAHPQWKLIYSDEDSLTTSGECQLPHFKPDFDLDLLRGYPYVGGALFIAGDAWRQLGGFASAWPDLEEYDLVLRAAERWGEQSVGHLTQVLLHRLAGGGRGNASLAQLCATAQAAVSAHLARLNVAAEVGPGLLPLSLRINYRHQRVPLVSILIVARTQLGKLQRALESLLGATGYANSELLLLDDGGTDADLREYLGALGQLGDPRIRIVHGDAADSLAACQNRLAGQAQGEYLLFFDAAAAALQDDWLAVLRTHAQRAQVGVVAPRLLNLDGTLRGGVTILGLDGAVGAAFSGLAIDDPGYFGRALLEQRVAAVAAGVWLTSRAAFAASGGLVAALAAEEAVADYCLRLAEAGLRALWSPYASLLCEAAAAPAASASESALPARWLAQLARDPAYSPHLQLSVRGAFACVDAEPQNWDRLPWKPLPRVLAQAADVVGCGQYRIIAPAHALSEAGLAQAWTVHRRFDPVEVERMQIDTLVFQRQVFDPQIEAVARHQRYGRALRVFELDDLLDRLPERSVHRGGMPKDIAQRLRRVIGMCDRLVVSTPPMAAAYGAWCGEVKVVPNYLHAARWDGLRPRRRQGARPRLGWVGGSGHGGDLALVSEVIEALAGEVEWVLMGMRLEETLPYLHEYHDGVQFDDYPDKVASLNLDLAIAPLEDNAFNEAKSNLRLLEYGILGVPVVCSDVYPYRGDFPVTRVRNRPQEWIEAIREHLADPDLCASRGDALRSHVRRHWLLEDHLQEWAAAWLP